jgi:hypothetical protein
MLPLWEWAWSSWQVFKFSLIHLAVVSNLSLHFKAKEIQGRGMDVAFMIAYWPLRHNRAWRQAYVQTGHLLSTL